jgi:hypothetical protein
VLVVLEGVEDGLGESGLPGPRLEARKRRREAARRTEVLLHEEPRA